MWKVLIFSLILYSCSDANFVEIRYGKSDSIYVANYTKDFRYADLRNIKTDSITRLYLSPEELKYIGYEYHILENQGIDPNKTASYLHMQKLEAERIQREQEYQREIDSLSNAIGHIEGFDVKEFFEGLDREIKKQREKNGSKN